IERSARSRLVLAHVAGLVLLAAAAPAGVVAAELGALALHRLHGRGGGHDRAPLLRGPAHLAGLRGVRGLGGGAARGLRAVAALGRRVGALLLRPTLRLRLPLLLDALEVLLARALHAAERVHHRG